MKRAQRLQGALVALVSLAALAACSDDATTSSDPIEVEVGEAFSWNGYTVDEGWELSGIERSVDMESVTTPEVSGTITNDAEETRTAIFEMVFSADGDALARITCSAGEMITDQSMPFICPGLAATMPTDYDAVVIQEYDRDTASS